MIGETFNYLTIIDIIKYNNKKYFICKCVCGKTAKVRCDHLKSGNIKSCGCFSLQNLKNRKKHGHTINFSKSLEYLSWRSMKQRRNSASYHSKDKYINRLICERWENSFEAFYEDMGVRPSKKHSLERIDNNLGYNKANCKWASTKEQNRNKSNNRWYEYNGKKMILSEWANFFRVSYSTISEHLYKKSFNEVVMFYKNKKGITI